MHCITTRKLTMAFNPVRGVGHDMIIDGSDKFVSQTIIQVTQMLPVVHMLGQSQRMVIITRTLNLACHRVCVYS